MSTVDVTMGCAILGVSLGLHAWGQTFERAVRSMLSMRHALIAEDAGTGTILFSPAFCDTLGRRTSRTSVLMLAATSMAVEVRGGTGEWQNVCRLPAEDRERVARFRGLRRYYRVSVTVPMTWFAPITVRSLVLV